MLIFKYMERDQDKVMKKINFTYNDKAVRKTFLFFIICVYFILMSFFLNLPVIKSDDMNIVIFFIAELLLLAFLVSLINSRTGKYFGRQGSFEIDGSRVTFYVRNEISFDLSDMDDVGLDLNNMYRSCCLSLTVTYQKNGSSRMLNIESNDIPGEKANEYYKYGMVRGIRRESVPVETENMEVIENTEPLGKIYSILAKENKAD